MILSLIKKVLGASLPRVKWLSCLMFATLMMLGVRFHHMGHKLSHWGEPTFSLKGSSGQAASAQQPVKPTPPPVLKPAPLETPKMRPLEKLASTQPVASQEGRVPVEKNEAFDLLNLTPEEFQVIQSIVSQRKSLQIEQDTRFQERKIEILDKSLSAKIAQLQQLKLSLQKIVATQEKKSEGNLAEIVKMYETMKPQEAAQIFTTLDLNVTLSIFKQMKGKKASAILASLPPEQAAQLTTALTQLNEDMKTIKTSEGLGEV